MESPKSAGGGGAYTRLAGASQQSTFGKAATMYKAESLSLEAMRGVGDRSNHSSFFPDQGWMDDSSLSRREDDDRLVSKYNQGTFTTGRTRSAKMTTGWSPSTIKEPSPPDAQDR